MTTELSSSRFWPCVAAAALAGCAYLPQPPQPQAVAPAPEPPPAAVAAPVAPPAEPRLDQLVFDLSDRLAALPPGELAQEIARMGDPGDSPLRMMHLAVALEMTGVASDAARAQALYRRVLEHPDAGSLRPLARLMLASNSRLAERRRGEEQIDRQTQQLRDAQRRIDQLSERLEAVRAVERGTVTRRQASAAGEARPPTP